MGFLPQAIDQSASYIKQNGISLEDYLQRFKSEPDKVLGFEDGYTSKRSAIAKQFRMILHSLERESPNSVCFLRLLSLFEPEAIPIFTGWKRFDPSELTSKPSSTILQRISACITCFPQPKRTGREILSSEPLASLEATTKSITTTETMAGKLRDLSLVRRPSESRALWMHDLTRYFVSQSIPSEDRSSWICAAIDILYHTFPNHDITAKERAVVDLFLPQAEALIKRAIEGEVEKASYAKLISICGRAYHNRGAYDRALECYNVALPLFDSSLGRENPKTIALLHSIGWSYRETGRMDLCEQFHWKTLEARERTFGKESPEALESINDLSSCIERQGRLKEAEKYFLLSYQRTKLASGQKHPTFLACAHNLALCYANQGRLDEAVNLYRQTLTTSEDVLGPEAEGTLKTLGNLAVAVDHQGYLAEAEALYSRALRYYTETLGHNHLLTLRVRSNISGLFRLMGRFEDSERIGREVLEEFLKVVGPEHFHSLIAFYDVAEILHEQGRMHEAQNYYDHSVNFMAEVSPEHPLLFRTIDALGILQREMGNFATASEFTNRAFEGNKKLLDWEDPYTLMTANNVAEQLHAEGKYQEALGLYRQTLVSLEELVGPKHPHCMMLLNNIGRLVWDSGEGDPEAYFIQALEGYTAILGDGHCCTLAVSLNLCRQNFSMGNFAEIEKNLRQIRDKFQTAVGAHHPYISLTNCFLGITLAAQGSMPEARKYLELSRNGYSKNLGLEHYNCIFSACILVRVLRILGDRDAADAILSTIDLTNLFQHIPDSNVACIAAWHSIFAFDAEGFDWGMRVPLQWGETTRLRWGRKTCWREAEKAALGD
ncbi:TPR-like protein [Zopfia rhizophila CBS 207.26]|uniref:TPR-like protein n=1 Tax=Zopfia rhizophila CBS 207.26 TaxID=1314779 RepID=A0A6A6DDA7_9PEZI|nr:TPR-like protein [Zopfia rhizophila CBS 207.26]